MRSLYALIAALLLQIVIFPQPKQKQKFHAFSGTFVLTFEGGTAIANTDYKQLRPDMSGRLSIEYFLPAFTKSSFGIRVFGTSGNISGQDAGKSPQIFRTEMNMAGLGAVYALQTSESVFPYFFAGAGYLSFNPMKEDGTKMPQNDAGVYKTNEVDFITELGVRFLVTENLSANILVNANLSQNDYLDDITAGANNDIYFTAMAGLSFSFFSERDSDNDGVVDSKDVCADTPPGVKVDEFGCPLDTDGDGVYDFMDKCPSTPKDVKIDKTGCPVNSDGDDVPDYLDLCPETPKGVKVDEFGCPFDLDADGVPDYSDKCPETPYGIRVDDKGCPLDSDLDGVPDHDDDCPDSPAGVQVNEKGCSIIKEEPVIEQEEELQEVVLSAGASFAFGSTNLLPAAYPDLDKIIEQMKKKPISRWRIEGHTDNIGSDKINKEVSLERAEAVFKYFTSKGINKRRFEVRGLGKDRPIAPNTSGDGRAKNRRVVITRIN